MRGNKRYALRSGSPIRSAMVPAAPNEGRLPGPCVAGRGVAIRKKGVRRMSVSSSAASPATTGRDYGIGFVIGASSAGTVIEWYDFYLYALLTPFLAPLFFPNDNPTASLLAGFAVYGAGFAVRPFGALVFGRIGDVIGRKYAFLLTVSIMGGATTLVGILPTYAHIGILAPTHPGHPAAGCRAWPWAASMAAPRSMSPSTRPTASAGCTPRGSRPPRRSACSARWRSFSRRVWPWATSLSRLGLARAVPALGHPGRRRAVHPSATAGDAALPADQGSRSDGEEHRRLGQRKLRRQQGLASSCWC